MSSMHARARVAAFIMKFSYFGLLIALTLSTWVWVQEGRQPSVTIWLIRLIPLAIFVSGLWKENLRSIAWLCFVVLLYFVMAVTESMSPFALWINYVELAMTVLLFCSATIFIRWHARSRIAAAAVNESGEQQ